MSSSEKPREVAQLTRDLESRLDDLVNPIYFDELLKTAEEICLTEKPVYAEPAPLSGEARIVSMLGTKGIKSALELSGRFTFKDVEEDGKVDG